MSRTRGKVSRKSHQKSRRQRFRSRPYPPPRIIRPPPSETTAAALNITGRYYIEQRKWQQEVVRARAAGAVRLQQQQVHSQQQLQQQQQQAEQMQQDLYSQIDILNFQLLQKGGSVRFLEERNARLREQASSNQNKIRELERRLEEEQQILRNVDAMANEVIANERSFNHDLRNRMNLAEGRLLERELQMNQMQQELNTMRGERDLLALMIDHNSRFNPHNRDNQ